MTVPTGADHMPPAARSGLDVALWFLIRASEERQRVPMEKLQLLLYLAAATFIAKHDGRHLLPGQFVAGAAGPYEPTVALALECGLNNPPQPSIAPEAEPLLLALWNQYGAMPTAALARIAGNDGVWQTALQRGAGSPIDTAALRQAYGAKRSGTAKASAKGDKAEKAAAPANKAKAAATARPEADLRFTGDGRLVTRWAPRRRIERH
ncbi:MAG TPA: hypothetical protein VMU42_11910 [Candidatus Sulfotelmatobacter sp.]|nr:hypothetical protein [Candidatus Sulfotelmatobacter sp.]